MSDDKIQFESEMVFDLTRANNQLLQFQKKLKTQQVEVSVKFDKNSAAAVDRLTASISALKRAGKGLDQFNIDMIDLRKNLSSFSNVPAFTKTAKNITDLSNSFLDLKNTAKMVGPTNDILTHLNKHLGALAGKAKGMENVGNFFRNLGAGINSLSKASQNIDNIEKSMGRLLALMKNLQASGGIDLLGQLPGNFGMNSKGQIRATPVKIVAPSMEEFSMMRNKWESEMARRPIRARISPEIDNRGLQKFQNLLIALSFGQFEAQLRRMSGAMIGNFSQIENAQTTLRTVYRDNPNKAGRAYNFLADYEQKTPFSFEEVIKGGTQFAVQETELKRVGFDLERIVKMSGELAAAFNGDIGEIQTGVSRVLSGDQNGLEILDKYGISRGVLKSQGVAIGPQGLKLSSQGDIRAVLEAMESFAFSKTGGNLAERRGETTQGVISNLQSQFFKTQAAMFEPVNGAFKEGAKIVTSFLKVVADLPEPIRALIGGATLITSAFLMVAQQASSLGLVLLGMNNAGLFDGFKKRAGGAAAEAGGTMLGSAAGGAAGAAGASFVATNLPTFAAAGAAIMAAMAAVADGVAGVAILALGGLFDIFTVLAGAMTAGIALLSAPAVGIAAIITAMVGAMYLTSKAISSPSAANMFDFVSGPAQRKAEQEQYRERWFGSSKAARKRQQSLARGKEIINMTGDELREGKVGKQEISDSLATAMQAEKEARENKDYKRAAQMQSDIDKLIDKRRDYNDLIQKTIDKQTTELKLGLDIVNAQKDLGIASQTQVLEKAKDRASYYKEVYDDRMAKGTYAEQQAALLDWLNALKDVKGAHEDILADQKAMLDNVAELRMGTGGTAKEDVDYLYAQANMMPNSTPQEKRAQDAAFNKARIREYELGQEGTKQRVQLTGLQGDTLGQKIQEINLEKKAAIEATGDKSGRETAEAAANLKIKQARAEHYMGLLKLAQQNLQDMQKIEQDRLALLQAALQKEKALRLAEQARTSIEEQYNNQSQIKRLDTRIEKGIQEDTSLKLKQSEQNFLADIQRLEAEKNALGPKATKERKSKDREIELRKETYKGEKAQISQSGKQALEEFRQETKFREEDLDLAAQAQILEDEAAKAATEKDRLQNQINTGKTKYIDLLKAELVEEKKILTANYLAATSKDKKLTTQQKTNLTKQYNQDMAKADKTFDAQVSQARTTVLTNQAGGIDVAMSQGKDAKTGKPKDPQKDLLLLKRKLEIEKQILFEKFKQESAAPKADQEALKVKYLQDLNQLQQKYLDMAKDVTSEFEAQNNAIKARQGFTLGGVFGIDQLGSVMAQESADSRAKYDAIGKGKKGPYPGYGSKPYPGYGPNDPFAKDKWEVDERVRKEEYEAGKLPTDSKVPSSMRDLNKQMDVKAEFTLKVITPDGKTTAFRSSKNQDVPPGGKGLA